MSCWSTSGDFDLREDLAAAYVLADVRIPVRDVSAGAGIDRRVGEGLQRGG